MTVEEVTFYLSRNHVAAELTIDEIAVVLHVLAQLRNRADLRDELLVSDRRQFAALTRAFRNLSQTVCDQVAPTDVAKYA